MNIPPALANKRGQRNTTRGIEPSINFSGSPLLCSPSFYFVQDLLARNAEAEKAAQAKATPASKGMWAFLSRPSSAHEASRAPQRPAQPQQPRDEGSDDEVECLGGSQDGGECLGRTDDRSASPSSDGGDREDDRIMGGAGDGMDSTMGGTADAQESTVPPQQCMGYRPDLPASPAAIRYPFAQHCSEESGRSINWSVKVSGAVVSLHAVKAGRREACTGKASSEGGPCHPCSLLEHCPKVIG